MKKKPTKIVILGAGFAGIKAYETLHKHLHGKNVHITLVSDKDYFLFVTLLHEVATGSLLPWNIAQPLRSLNLCCMDEFVEGVVESVDLDRKRISVCRKPFDVAQHENVEKSDAMLADISYDYLISGLGSKVNFYNTPGAKEYAFALKVRSDAKGIKNRLIDNFAQANEIADETIKKALLHTVIIGGGPTGVEVAGELADYVNKEMYSIYPTLQGKARITLFHGGEALLQQVDTWFHEKATEILKKKGVEVIYKTFATAISQVGLVANNRKVEAGLVVWTAGVKATETPFTGSKEVLREEKMGRIKVNEFLQIPSYPHVFVVGDQACITEKESGVPYPMRAQFASREGKVAADNINALMHTRQLTEFAWKDQGFIVSLGKGGALASVYGVKLSGPFAWWVYRTVYASKIVGWRAKVRTVGEWTLNLFFPRDVSKLD